VAAAPFLIARIVALGRLGLRQLLISMVTRTEYFGILGGSHVNPVFWLFGVLFPIFGVTLLCLAIRYAFPGTGPRAAYCYAAVLVVCGICALPSGGRADLVFVLGAVLFATRAHGYRTTREFLPVLIPVAFASLLLFFLAQARTGHANSLTALAGNPYVGNDYSSGEITQLLGTGRFDGFRMIISRHSTAHGLGAQDYLEAIKGTLDSVFLPRIATGHAWSFTHPALQVMGPWQFGTQKASSLPSAPGELYLTFGVPGVLAGAVLFGFVTRLVLRLVAAVPGPAQISWVLAVWTLSLGLSTEAYLLGSFIVEHWPVVPLIGLLVRRHPITSPAPPSQPPLRPTAQPSAAPPGRPSRALPSPTAVSLRG
jgi:hypothetical protein